MAAGLYYRGTVQCRLGRAHRPFAGQCAGGGNACHDLFHRQGADGCVRRSFEQYGLDSAETTNLLYNGGLRIYTTVDPDLQAVMENALERGYSSFFPTSGLGVATQATKYNEDGTIARDENGDPIREDVVETPQAAMVSVGYDGSLKAIVGGIGEKRGEPRAEPRHRAPARWAAP